MGAPYVESFAKERVQLVCKNDTASAQQPASSRLRQQDGGIYPFHRPDTYLVTMSASASHELAQCA